MKHIYEVLVIYKSVVWICFKCSLYEGWHMYSGQPFSEQLQYHMQNKTYQLNAKDGMTA